jgi:peptidoglycan/LPS O-acetylase OafA/YrhL
MILSFVDLLIVIILLFAFGKRKETSDGLLSFNNTMVMRGIAILMVVIHHMSLWFGTNIFTPLGGGGVAIFLILSGFGLTKSYQKNGVSKFWWKRFVGVFIPWLLVVCLTMQPWKAYDQQWFWKYLFFIDFGPWYLQYLFVWYIIFYMTHCHMMMFRFRWYIIGISTLAMFWCWTPIQQEQSLCFPLGVWMGENYHRLKSVNRHTCLKIASFAVVGSVVALGAKQIPWIRSDISSIPFVTLQIVLKTAMAIAVIAVVPFVTWLNRNRFLWFTGLISYEMYLIHGFIYDYLLTLMGSETTLLLMCWFWLVNYAACYLLFKADDGIGNLLNTIRKKAIS